MCIRLPTDFLFLGHHCLGWIQDASKQYSWVLVPLGPS